MLPRQERTSLKIPPRHCHSVIFNFGILFLYYLLLHLHGWKSRRLTKQPPAPLRSRQKKCEAWKCDCNIGTRILSLKLQSNVLETRSNTTDVVESVGSDLGWKGMTNDDGKVGKMYEEGYRTPYNELKKIKVVD
jgi:hypothetical protein